MEMAHFVRGYFSNRGHPYFDICPFLTFFLTFCPNDTQIKFLLDSISNSGEHIGNTGSLIWTYMRVNT
jgi:hypothetical protein